MAEPSDTRDPVELLTEEFLELHRQGLGPTVDEYADAHPQWADRIRKLFPTLIMMEGLKSDAMGPPSSSTAPRGGSTHPSQLGDFRIEREIGRGGMGVVYLATEHSLGRSVAVKVLPPELMNRPHMVERFRREAQAAARLHHTNIVPVFGTGQDEGFNFYVMQFIEGHSLDRVLKTIRANAASDNSSDQPVVNTEDDFFGDPSDHLSLQSVVRRLMHGRVESSSTMQSPRQASRPQIADDSKQIDLNRSAEATTSAVSSLTEPLVRTRGSRYWRNVATIGLQTASAVHYAHRLGTLHRDIKPANLLLDGTGTVWVTDFGLAKLSEYDDITQPGDVVGTLRYMAPEQLEGTSDCRSDVYSIGLTLYELLTLRPAFDAPTRAELLRLVSEGSPQRPRAIDPSIPSDLETIVLKATAKEPGGRYSTAADLAEDLERFLDDRPILARRVSPAEHAWRWCRRNPALSATSALALALLVITAVGMTFGYYNEMRLRAKTEANLRLAASAFESIFDQVGGSTTSSAFEETSQGRLPSALYQRTDLSPRDTALLETILSFYDEFAEENQDNSRWLYETAMARRRMGQIYRRLGRTGEAESSFERSLEDYERLSENVIGGKDFSVDVAAIQNELGIIASMSGIFPQALQQHRDALEILQSAPSDMTSSDRFQLELAKTYTLLAKGATISRVIESRLDGDTDTARNSRAWMNSAIAILKGLQQQHDDDVEVRFLLAECLHLVWMSSQFDGSLDRSSPPPAEAMKIIEELAEEYPEDPRFQSALAHAYVGTSRSPFFPGNDDRIKKHRRMLEKAVSISLDLTEKYPGVPQYQDLLERCRCTLANVLLDLGEFKQSQQLCQQTMDKCRSLEAASAPAPFYFVVELRARTLMAANMLAQGQIKPALGMLREALSDSREIPAEIRGSTVVRAFQADAYLLLAAACAANEDPNAFEEANHEATELLDALSPVVQASLPTDRWMKLVASRP